MTDSEKMDNAINVLNNRSGGSGEWHWGQEFDQYTVWYFTPGSGFKAWIGPEEIPLESIIALAYGRLKSFLYLATEDIEEYEESQFKAQI